MKYELHDYLEKTIPRSTNQMSREIIHFSGSIELDRGLIKFDNLFQWKYQVQRYKTMLFNVTLVEIFLKYIIFPSQGCLVFTIAQTDDRILRCQHSSD